MLNIAKITIAVAEQLRRNPGVLQLIGDPQRIVRAEYVNRDPANAPWIGVYRQPIDFDPRTLGNGAKNWLAKTSVVIVCQTHADGGEKSEDALASLVDAVLDAIVDNLHFNYDGAERVEMITGLKVEWDYQKTETETLDFQQANIVVEFENRAPEE